MNRLSGRVLAPMVLSLALFASTASATSFTFYTSESALLGALPPGTDFEDFIGGSAEFGDTFGGMDRDFNLTYSAGGSSSIIQIPDDMVPGCSGLNSECYWLTTGEISFALDTGAANMFVISWVEPSPLDPRPTVFVTLMNNSEVQVGPFLFGDPFEGGPDVIFGFTSTDPFKAVRLVPAGASDQLQTQFAALANVQPVPEPATLLLVATGVLASGRRLLRSGHGRRRAAALDEKRSGIPK